MKKTTLFFLLIFIAQYTNAQCGSAYSQATYALSHTKKSLSSDNFDHQKYYADRALEALGKTKTLVEACGCSDAVPAILDGLDNLTQATDPADWEAGRFYSQHAYEHLQTLMSKLDICTSGGTTSSIDYSPELAITQEGNNTETINYLEQQKKLELEKQRLLEQQQELEEKIVKQRQLAEQARVNRQLELEQQIKLKHLVEQKLFDLEKDYKQLFKGFGCVNIQEVLNGGYSREDAVLNSENLTQTRNHYVQITIETQEKLLEVLKKCAQSNL
ncbi:hypothetical protein I215_04635 [Galbibacter marinus]|uniref:Outer membrane protein n=1 Tax=Galbibacter marinus TaxID=555500 RepID=K2PXP4_9FLAO|nr:hypothetical protein [Galbibacter marinus]EKF56204.1 hypothetical protein I215_04635 [Galbibacter marinus]